MVVCSRTGSWSYYRRASCLAILLVCVLVLTAVILYVRRPDPALVRTFEAPDKVSAVAFSPDGARLLSGHRDGTISLWDVETGEKLLRLAGHKEKVEDIAFRAGSDQAVSVGGGRYGTIRLWDLVSGEQIVAHKYYDSGDISIFPDGSRVLRFDAVLDVDDGQVCQSLDWPDPWPDGYPSVPTAERSFTPDGKRVIAPGISGYVIYLWDFERGEPRKYGPSPSTEPESFFSLAISPDGKKIAEGGGDFLRMRDSETWKLIWLARPEKRGYLCMVDKLAYSPDGKYLLARVEYELELWDARAGKQLKRFRRTTLHGELTFSPDGRYAVSTHEKTIYLWDLQRAIAEASARQGGPARPTRDRRATPSRRPEDATDGDGGDE